MLFPEEDAPLLKTWIVKRIEDTSDADSEVLAEYIIALLKHEGSKEEVRKLCEAEIPDFLTEDPAKFLDDVFRAIAYKSYVPGAAPPPPTRELDIGPAQEGGFGVRPDKGNATAPVSRKRGYRDLDAPRDQQDSSQNPRPTKNARRNGPEPGAQQGAAQGDFQPMNMPSFDPENSMAALMEMNMNMQMMQENWPQFSQMTRGGGRGGRKKNRRCRDFDTKGYCSRGASCKYEHGYEGGFMPTVGDVGGDYNPEDPNVTLADPQAQSNPWFNPWTMQPQNPPSRGRGNKKGRGQRRRGGGRAPFSKEGPESDTSKSTIVVENIPEENFTEDEVRDFFSTFGNITELSLQPYKRLAVIEYETWDSANAAYSSPKAIFENRFVKVFWYRDESQIAQPDHANGAPYGNGEEESEPFDPEEFARKQEEAQKAYEEKEVKRAELEQMKQELERKQQDLLDRHKAESVKLQSALQAQNGSSDSSETNPLRAQLALLEQEAKMLGIDPDAPPADDTMSMDSWSTARGGWRGRGRGRGRARGRGRGRGSFRGVDDRHAAYSRYSLDLRPRRVAISGVDFTDAKKEETLRHFLLNLGEFDSVEPTSDSTTVTLRDRKTAERLYMLLNGNMLPGVEGELQLEYLPNIPGPAASTETDTYPGGGVGGDPPLGIGGVGLSGEGGGLGGDMVIDASSDVDEGEVQDADADADAGLEEEYPRKNRIEDDDAY